jgi:hypothetical protein
MLEVSNCPLSNTIKSHNQFVQQLIPMLVGQRNTAVPVSCWLTVREGTYVWFVRNEWNLLNTEIYSNFLLVLIPLVFSDQIQSDLKITKYSCDGAKLQLLCRPFFKIRIIRANYGRFSISVCNEEAINTMRTDCGNPIKTSEIISNLCEDKAECEIEVNEADLQLLTVLIMANTWKCIITVNWDLLESDFQT